MNQNAPDSQTSLQNGVVKKNMQDSSADRSNVATDLIVDSKVSVEAKPLPGAPVIRFEDVISGQFDADEDRADVVPQKRVLAPQPETPKLHKVLAQAGLGSRLEMEQLITEGRISVNNEPAHIGQRVQFGDQVKVNGKPIRVRIDPPPARVIAYHKPVGEVVTNDDPQNRPTVFRKLPRLYQGKWQSVGRLDLNTEGLLLFTSSGELANKLMHPRFGLEREYAVRVLGALSNDEKQRLLALTLMDEDGHSATAHAALSMEAANDPVQAQNKLRENLARLGETLFAPMDVALNLSQPWFVPASTANTLRRDAVAALEAARAAAWTRLPRAKPVEPPVAYPEDTLTYLANVYNHKARDFYAKHGVKVIAAAYESHEEEGEVSLMITKHCVRFSMSLCPKQAKGVTGVQGTIRAEPLTLINGNDKLTLRFDCKPCEMHVVGKIRHTVLHPAKAVPLTFYRTRPATAA
jgi:pseudouridine synthase